MPAQLSEIIFLLIILILVYLQLFPDFDYGKVIFAVDLRDGSPSIAFTAMSLFTQSIFIVIVLFAKPLLTNMTQRGRLTNALIRLEGVDDPDIGPVESFVFFEWYIQYFRLKASKPTVWVDEALSTNAPVA